MAFQPGSGTAAPVAWSTGGLLHHLLTLIPTPGRDGYFLLPYSTLTNSFPFGSPVPYAARTFLPYLTVKAIERAACPAKVMEIFRFLV